MNVYIYIYIYIYVILWVQKQVHLFGARVFSPLRGARQIVDAMQQANVSRLVVLSSMGIGDDYLPTNCMKCFWGCLLTCVWPSTRRDLEQMEAIVTESDLDYLLVRPMGVDPGELPRNLVAEYAHFTLLGIR